MASYPPPPPPREEVTESEPEYDDEASLVAAARTGTMYGIQGEAGDSLESSFAFVQQQLIEIDQVLRQEDQTTLIRALGKSPRLATLSGDSKHPGFVPSAFLEAICVDLGFEYNPRERSMFLFVLATSGRDWVSLGRVQWVLKHSLEDLVRSHEDEKTQEQNRLKYLAERALLLSPDPEFVKTKLTQKTSVAEVLHMTGRMDKLLLEEVAHVVTKTPQLLINTISDLWSAEQDLVFVEQQLASLFDRLTKGNAQRALTRAEAEQLVLCFDHSQGVELILGSQQTFTKAEFVDLFYWLARRKADWLTTNAFLTYAPVSGFNAASRLAFIEPKDTPLADRLRGFFENPQPGDQAGAALEPLCAELAAKPAALATFRSAVIQGIRRSGRLRHTRPFVEEVMKTNDAIRQGIIGGPAVELTMVNRPSVALLRPSLDNSNLYINDPLFIELARFPLDSGAAVVEPATAPTGCCGSPNRASPVRASAVSKDRISERLISGGAAYRRGQLERFTQIRIFEVLGGSAVGGRTVGVTRVLRVGWWKNGSYVGCVWESGISEDGKIARVDSEVLVGLPNSANLQAVCFRLELVKLAEDAAFENKTSSVAFLNLPASQFMTSSGDKAYTLSGGVTVNMRLNRPTNVVFKDAILLPENFLATGVWWLPLVTRLRFAVACDSSTRLAGSFRSVIDDFNKRRIFARELRGLIAGSLEDALGDHVREDVLITAALRAQVTASVIRGGAALRAPEPPASPTGSAPSSLASSNLRYLESILSGEVLVKPVQLHARVHFEDLAIN